MKLIQPFVHACTGIQSCFKSERNLKIHFVASIVAVIFSLLCKISPAEWIAVCFCIAFVTAMEMMNTAIEKLCDVVYKETHPAIKLVKDIAAGAVLVPVICSLITAGIIFLPKIIMYLNN
jgi:diacylglycerol kinase